jgi:outer membrane protein assembly factor BamB
MAFWALQFVLCLALGTERPAAARRGFTYETLGAVWAAPLVAPDGRVFVGSEDGFFYAFTPGGRLLWTYKADGGFSGWPLAVDGRSIAVANRGGRVYFFDLEGRLLRRVAIEGAGVGRMARFRDRLYLGTDKGHVVALKGREILWSHATGSPITGWPVVTPAGWIIAGCADGNVVSLDEQGNRLWRAALGAPVASGIVAARRAVWIATRRGDLVLLDARGREQWKRPHKIAESGLAALEGGVVFGDDQGTLTALDSSGKTRWKFAADGPIRSFPSVTTAGIVFGTDRGTLYVLDHGGEPRHLLSAAGPLRGGATLAGGGVFFGSQDRRIYAVPVGPLDRRDEAERAVSTRIKAALKQAAMGRLLWRRELSGAVANGVAPGPEGSLLASTWGKRLFVLGAGGEVRWTWSCNEDIDTLPAVGAGGDILFGCQDGGFYGLKATGDMRFRYPVNKPLASSPAVARDGTIYFGAGDKRIYALTREGKVLWRVLTGDDVDSAPRIAPDGMVYIGADDRHLYAVGPLGHVSWYFRTGGAVRSRPALGPDGTIYVTSFDQTLYALTGAGSEKWSYQTDGQILASPLSDSEGNVYFGSRDHRLYALDPEGKVRFRFETLGEVDSEPALTPDGTLVFGSDDGNLYALSEDGALKWWYAAGAEIHGRLLSRADGTIIFGTMAGAVVAVAPPAAGQPPSEAALPHLEHRVLWRTRVGHGRTGPLTFLRDGTLVVAGADGVLRAIGTDRWPLWAVRIGDSALRRAIVAGNDLYLTDARGNLAAVRDGTLRFRLRLDRAALTEPALFPTSAGPLVLAGTPAGRVWAVTPEGKVRWFWSGAAAVHATPLSMPGHVVVAAGSEVVGLDEAGQRRWTSTLPVGITAGPLGLAGLAIVADGRGTVRALDRQGKTRWQRDAGAGVLAMVRSGDETSVVLRTADDRVVELAADGEQLLAVTPSAPLAAIGPANPQIVCLTHVDNTVAWLDRRTGQLRTGLTLPAPATDVVSGGEGSTVFVTQDGELLATAGGADGDQTADPR